MSDLPEELLQQIVSEFDAHEFEGHENTLYGNFYIYQRTLLSLSRVNKQFHRLAQPLLYTSIASKWHNGPWALQLLRTLLEQPKLADLVQSVRMAADMFEHEDESTPSEELEHWDAELNSQVTERVEEISNYSHLSERLLESLKNGNKATCYNGAACMALLLFIAKNITFLHLSIPFRWDECFVAEIAEDLGRLSHAPDATNAKPAMLRSVLPHLKTLEIEHWDTEMSTDLGRLSNLISLPSLEVLRGHMVSLVLEDNEPYGNGSWPLNFETIDLTSSLMDASGLEMLLRRCPNLQHLSVEWGGAIIGDCELDWPQMGDALRQYPKSLKSLRLDASMSCAFEYAEPPFQPLGDLSPLVRLEKLAVHGICLLGEKDEDLNVSASDLAKVLPESLVELELLSWYIQGVEDNRERLKIILSELKDDERFEALAIIG